MKVTILNGTTKNPLQAIGERAGICWGGDTSNKEKNIKRAIDCITSGHGRVLEYVSIEFVVEDISARAVRELYTHIAGGPTRLQSSTRYINYDNFEYYTPTGNPELESLYDEAMKSAAHYYRLLIEEGMSKEDAANLLPLGMTTKVVMKTNLRMIENLMGQRLCTRAYKEMREFAMLLSNKLYNVDSEWREIANNLFVPKCKKVGYCTETKCCGLSEKKEINWVVEV
jgi:thymidylate synthase (FAD)